MLIIGDLHLHDKYPGYLDWQVQSLIELCDVYYVQDLLFLGDVFEKRQPSPKELLALKTLLDTISNKERKITILRGNHDSQTKADDGLSSLSLFEKKNRVRVITHTKEIGGFIFIPHYENEERIKKDLELATPDNILFGHFGYTGCVNSFGDYDFNIGLSSFNSPTFLGHIHNFARPTGNPLVTVVGTPYSTSFQEAGKKNYIVNLNCNDIRVHTAQFEIEEINIGPKYHIVKYEDLKDFKPDSNDYNILRVLLDPLAETNKQSVYDEVMDEFKPKHLELKFKPLLLDVQSKRKQDVSSFIPDGKLLKIDDTIIKEYVESNKTDLKDADIMAGLELLKNGVTKT